MKQFHRWCIKLAITVSGLLLGVGVLNALVDPYMLYGVKEVQGLTANKNIATSHSRMIKPVLIERIKPRGLILGSSRAEVGLDPGHPSWGEQNQPVYNYAFGGIGIQELADRFAQALDKTEVKTAVIGLDFYMFNAFLNSFLKAGSFDNDSLYYLKTLWSIDALQDSIDTLRKQDPVKSPELMPNGQVAWTFNVARVAKYGHRHGFLRFERHFLEDSLFPLPHKEYGFYDPYKDHDSFSSFRKILYLARKHQVDLKLYISPHHARLLEVYRQAGLWYKYLEWKRRLVEAIAMDAADHPAGKPVPLYDFSLVNSMTAEVVPVAGDTKTEMQYFWEASHFKKETGDLLQARLFADPDSTPTIEGFGLLLTPQNVEGVLLDTQKRLDAYLAKNPDAREDIMSSRLESTWR